LHAARNISGVRRKILTATGRSYFTSSIGSLQTKTVETLRQTLKTAVLEENKKKELTNVIQAHFKEWLLGEFPLPVACEFQAFSTCSK
jgi:hypothetical protein